MKIPARNEQFGYLVGGTWNSNDYRESVTDYAMTECGIDYNAGLVGTLGYIVSKLAPADTARMVGTVRKRHSPAGVHAPASCTVSRLHSGWNLKISDGRRIDEITAFDRLGRRVFHRIGDAAMVYIAQKTLPHGMLSFRVRCEGGNMVFAHLCTMR